MAKETQLNATTTNSLEELFILQPIEFIGRPSSAMIFTIFFRRIFKNLKSLQ